MVYNKKKENENLLERKEVKFKINFIYICI